MSTTKAKTRLFGAAAGILCGLGLVEAPTVHADEYASALANFKAAGASARFIQTAYGYALFPDVGEGATAQAGASAATNGVEANASTTVQNATTEGAYEHGMAVFTIAKGGLMFAADIGGQKFTYEPRHYHRAHQMDQAAP